MTDAEKIAAEVMLTALKNILRRIAHVDSLPTVADTRPILEAIAQAEAAGIKSEE